MKSSFINLGPLFPALIVAMLAISSGSALAAVSVETFQCVGTDRINIHPLDPCVFLPVDCAPPRKPSPAGTINLYLTVDHGTTPAQGSIVFRTTKPGTNDTLYASEGPALVKYSPATVFFVSGYDGFGSVNVHDASRGDVVANHVRILLGDSDYILANTKPGPRTIPYLNIEFSGLRAQYYLQECRPVRVEE